MTKTYLAIAFLITGFLLSGCAGTTRPANRDFVRPTQETLKLGETTYSQVVQLFGEPQRPHSGGKRLVHGKPILSIMYSYGSITGEPLEHGILPRRIMHLSFLNDILVSQMFTSSFKSDHSNFDYSKINAIVKGKTTRSEVIQLMGKPSGFYIPPMVTASKGVGYLYTTTRIGEKPVKVYTKSLEISFNENDVVSDIRSSWTK